MKRKKDSVEVSRRGLLAGIAATPVLATAADAETSPQTADPHRPAYLDLAQYIAAGQDEFTGERAAMQLRAYLHRAFETRELLASNGVSPCPARYEQMADGVARAIYDGRQTNLTDGWKKWIDSLGKVRRKEFYVLPEDIVRYEVASEIDEQQHYRVGSWRIDWQGGTIRSIEPLGEELATSREPLFRDVTAAAFRSLPAFAQLSKGIPYWRSRLDPACGIDIYGSNGIAVGDIDGDGEDEIYICQPGGLPNRLLKFSAEGALIDVTEQWKVGLLNDTSCALFLDLRNSGKQDLVVLLSGGPVLFTHAGDQYRQNTEAFRFATRPMGGFTGMSAADFDRDGKLDLYLCCYVYFQSEAQYTYASPYHDAQNGPPNFLFRNRLNADGSGFFEDCTAETGINENNNRFSFAPAWCDFNDDGWPDLFVANDFGRKNLYVNRNGRFRDEAAAAGVEDIGPGMSASWFDYDGDGKADLYVANMWSDAGQRVVRNPQFRPAQAATNKEAYGRHTRGNSLYRNNGDGKFADTTFAQHAEFGRWAWSACGVDLDNDGSPEIFSTSGMLTNESSVDLMGFFWRQVVAKSPAAVGASVAYQNGWNAINQFVREEYSWNGHEPNVLHMRRDDRYYDFSGISGLDFAEDSRAFAVTDIDGDGKPDIILKSRLGPQVRVLQNNCCGDHQSITLQLTGTKCNRDAIGARVTVDGRTKWLDAGSGFLSQHSKRLIFGLGRSSEAKNIEIKWPSGTIEKFSNWKGGYRYRIREGDLKAEKTTYRPRPHLEPLPLRADNSLKTEDTWLVEPIPLPDSVSGPGLLLLTETASQTAHAHGTTVVDLSSTPQEKRQQYEIFRRYLFDWRTGLQFPMAFLLDEKGHAVKIYGSVPEETRWQADLKIRAMHREKALPFAGTYITQPRRDFAKYGIAYLISGYPDQALPYFDAVLRRSPDNARVLALVGQIYLNAQRFHEAEAYYRKAITNGGETPENTFGLATCLAKQNQFGEARELLKKSIELRPDYADAINDLGALYMHEGQINDAVAAFRYGVQVAPDKDILYLNLGRTLIVLRQYDEARQVMQQLLDRKPGNQTAKRALEELNGR